MEFAAVSAARSSGFRMNWPEPPAARRSANRCCSAAAPNRRCAFPARARLRRLLIVAGLLRGRCAGAGALFATAIGFWAARLRAAWDAARPERRRCASERRVLASRPFRYWCRAGRPARSRLPARTAAACASRAAEQIAEQSCDRGWLLLRGFAFLRLRRRLRHRHARHHHRLGWSASTPAARRRGEPPDWSYAATRRAPSAVPATWMRRPSLS